jgi:predicted dehydrogenase/threonine dehydrogenase-like Zn-dependent dehydrogenase
MVPPGERARRRRLTAGGPREEEVSVKQVAQNYKRGELSVLEVPAPTCRPGGVIVRSLYSLISTGTEVMKVAEANLSLIGKARSRPDQVKKVLDTVAAQGIRSTYTKAMAQLDSYTPLGYSLCGVVEEVGRGAEEFTVGQLVACAGNEFALHAEVNWVPRNLCVPLPAGVSPVEAAFATVGAIAMHGVRRAEVQLGDTACVVGLGLVGQLVVQLLVAAGVRVAGLDTVADRCRLAEKAGAEACDAPTKEGVERLERALSEMSGGFGADHVFLVAGGSSNGPVEAAARLARDRARVVDIGKLKLDLPWNAYYDKELDVRFSRSYGPGRYDRAYELEGSDYPIGYVRWTERRNLQCFLDLLHHGSLKLDLLVSEVFPLDEAPTVYERLRAGDLRGVGFLFEYGAAGRQELGGATRLPVPERTAPLPTPRRATSGLRVGFIGAGSYASSMLLPHLAGRSDVALAQVVTNTALSAANAQRRFGFETAATDVDALLGDQTIEAVFIVTRHRSHADLVCRALEAGKSTFVEKPLALHGDELERVLATVERTGNDRLMVGFNRRFAPLVGALRQRFGQPGGGALVRYMVNAGPLGAGSWYADEAVEGSRFTGEGGHFIDTIGWWLGASPVELHALSTTGGDLHVALRFDNGSIGTVDYLVNGSTRLPKETFDVSSAGRTARFENFARATVWQGRRRRTLRSRGSVDKGQRAQLAAFLEAVRTGGPMPIPLPSLVATTAATIAVGRSLEAGGAVTL